ncbi:MAG TPA: hypothetical protein VG497_03845 [Kribbella sp.]|nr:hypothetical protein [Kribbella sp.]
MLLVLAVPIGTVFGAWLGQKTAAARDDARWEREREREDTRWERELEREEARWQREAARAVEQRRHELAINLRDRLLTSYGEFLAAYDRMHAAASLLALRTRGSDSAREPLRQLEDSFAGALRTMDTLRVIADSEVYQECFDALQLVSSPTYNDDDTEKNLRYLHELVERRQSLYTSIRTELGVHNPEWQAGTQKHTK